MLSGPVAEHEAMTVVDKPVAGKSWKFVIHVDGLTITGCRRRRSLDAQRCRRVGTS